MSARTKLRALLWLVLALSAVGLVLEPTVRWSGYVDLTVEFVVTDARTGKPVPGAELFIFNEGGRNADGLRMEEAGSKGEQFTLRTDERGIAQRVSEQNRAYGRSNRVMPFRNTFGFCTPTWHILSARAPGYAPTEPVVLPDVPGASRSGRIGANQARLVVPLKLEPLP
jgi:hypothetical protein